MLTTLQAAVAAIPRSATATRSGSVVALLWA
jgi:hypothetical protein